MRIDEAECLIARERDALTGRSDGRYGCICLRRQRCRQLDHAIEIEVALQTSSANRSIRFARSPCSPACTNPR